MKINFQFEEKKKKNSKWRRVERSVIFRKTMLDFEYPATNKLNEVNAFFKLKTEIFSIKLKTLRELKIVIGNFGGTRTTTTRLRQKNDQAYFYLL